METAPRGQVSTVKEKQSIRPAIKTAYSNFSHAQEARITDRDEQRCLAQMRSTDHKAFGDYQVKIGKADVSTCHRCYIMADSVTHFITECPATRLERARLTQ